MRSFVEALLADRNLHIIDDEGRPLTEQADPVCPETREVICAYSGRRHGMPINPAALGQVNRHWTAISQELRQTVPAKATLQQAFEASLEMVSAPLLWTSGPLPGFLAARYKTGVGFCQVFAWLLLQEEGQGERPLASLGCGSEFAIWVETEGWLQGSRQACAGSAGQIASLFDVFCSGLGSPSAPSMALEAVALQAALLLSSYAALREPAQPVDDSLGCRLLEKGRAPWLYAVTARPSVAPGAARRLFPANVTVRSLESFLTADHPTLSHARRESLFWEAALQIAKR